MKLSKKLFLMNIYASLLVSSIAVAETGRSYKIISKRPSDVGGATGSTRPGGVITQATSETILPDKSKATAQRECRMDQGESEYIPTEMYETLTKNGEPLELVIRDDNKIEVKFTRYLDACGKVIPELEQNPQTLDVMVLLKIQQNGKTIKYSDYLACLEQKGFVKDQALDHGNIPASNYTSISYTLPFNFDKVKDVKKTAKVSIGYPFAFSDPVNGYSSKNGFLSQDIVPGSSCMLEEKIAAEPVYINKGRDVLLAEIEAVCNTGDLDKLKELLRSLGNMDALRDDFENVRHHLAMKLLESAYAESEKYMKSMEKIEEKINTSKSTMTEQEAKKEIKKYVDLTQKLNETYLDPAITVLSQLMTERQALVDATDDEDTIQKDLERYDAQIADLNNKIAQFSERNTTAHANIYSMMQKYALNDSAKKIEDVRLKSHFFARVNAGGDQTRGKPITIDQANKEHQTRSKNFQKTLGEWTDVYLVSKGNMEPIQRVERERNHAIQRMNTRYQKMEEGLIKDYQSSCKVGMLGAVQNQAKCQRFLNTVQRKREMEYKRRERDLYYIKGRNNTLDKMGMSYNAYQMEMEKREIASQDGYASFGGGSSEYANYDASYSELYPLYDGPQMDTRYQGNMFTFGGQQQMGMPQMGMQQQGMMGQQGLQQPAMMQPYQQQQGGWASF